jgi:uncharacterized SAM-binding protein YcdF (DUF218 family)
MKFLILFPILLLALVVGLSIYLQPNDLKECDATPTGAGDCQTVDAIVVVSGGDTDARTDEGILLYKNGWADTLIFSGAAQDKTGPSNAAAMRQHALKDGVPDDAILIEELSETTTQNAENTESVFENNDIKKAILVTSGYHQRRASLSFSQSNSQAAVLNSPVENDDDWSVWWWTTPRGWWLATGEVVKIIALYTQGVVR